jgi:hypothetical protein
MELRNILSKIRTTKEEEQKYFFGLQISPESVSSAVWTVKEERAVIIKMGSTEEWNDQDDFVEAAAATLEKAGENIKPQPKDLIFGLPKDWVEGKDVRKKYKALLQRVCESQSLKPVGFVVTVEALVEYIKVKEGVPVNAILIGLEETDVGVYWAELGEIKDFHKVGRSGDLAADVREGLARFGDVENFPARMILFDGLADFEEAKQQLLSYDWEEKLPFLHVPKIESLGANIGVKAVAVAGGAEVARALGFQVSAAEEEFEQETDKKTKTEIKKESRSKKETKADLQANKVKKQEANKEEKNEQQEEEESAESIDKDKPEEEKPPQSISGISSGDEFGFQEKDILKVEAEAEGEDFSKGQEQRQVKPAQISSPQIDNESAPQFKKSQQDEKNFFRKISSSFGGFFANLSGVFQKQWLVVVLGLIGGLAVIGGVLFYLYWNVPKAEVKIYVSPKVLEKEMDLVLASESTSEAELKGEKITKAVSGSKTRQTTGDTLVGEKASGEVTIYNKTDVEKTFAVGTVLVGKDNLQYLLDEEVTIASKSSELLEDGEKIVYGKADGKITAGSIGSEYNVSKDSEFSLQEYAESQFSATAKTEISGGMSREVKAVSEEDLSSLKNGLVGELKTEAKEELKNEAGDNEEIIITEEMDISKEAYSAEVGEESDQVSLELEVKLNAFIYDQKKLENKLKKDFYELVPRGYTFDSSEISISVLETTVEEEAINLKVNAKANLVPKMSIEEIKENLAGRHPGVAKGYLSGLPNFVRAEIEMTPSLPEQIQTLPQKKENINISLKVE